MVNLYASEFMSIFEIDLFASSTNPKPAKKTSVSTNLSPKISESLPGAILLMSSICHNLS